MDAKKLSISFVGVFKTPQAMIPQLDTDFCKNVFHSPENTISGYTQSGFMIRMSSLQAPIINISTEKIIILARELSDLLDYVGALSKVLPEYEYQSYGLNQEIEYTNINTQNSAVWMHDKFLQDRLKLGTKFNACARINLQFDITENEFLNLDIEPRANVTNGIFIAINHHNSYPMSGLPAKGSLKELFESSDSRISGYLKTIIPNE